MRIAWQYEMTTDVGKEAPPGASDSIVGSEAEGDCFGLLFLGVYRERMHGPQLLDKKGKRAEISPFLRSNKSPGWFSRPLNQQETRVTGQATSKRTSPSKIFLGVFTRPYHNSELPFPRAPFCCPKDPVANG